MDQENIFSQNTSSKKGEGGELFYKQEITQEIVQTNTINSNEMRSPSELAFTDQKIHKVT